MTDVLNETAQERPLITPRHARRLFPPNPAALAGKIGLEVEMHLYRPEGGAPAMIGPDVMQALQHDLAQEGHEAQLEAASVLEYASPAMPQGELPALLDRVAADLSVFRQAAAAHGATVAPLPIMPGATFEQAFTNMIDRPRLRVGINALARVSPHGATAISLLTAGVQVSLSPKDNEQLFRMTGRAYALTPLLLAAMNSDGGFAENNTARQTFHQRGAYYQDYGTSGGISKAYLQATDAASFLQNHAQEVFGAPMYFAFAPDGRMLPATLARPLRFGGLPIAMKTEANFHLAASFLYHDVKLCNLRDAHGRVTGKRIEVRAADSGAHQPFTTLLMTSALVPDGPTATRFESLLHSFGFQGTPTKDAELLLAARQGAVHHGGKFMDVPFGRSPQTGEPARLLDFAREVAGLLEAHYATRALSSDSRKQLGTLTHILREGESVAKLNASRFADLPALNEALLRHAARPVEQVLSPSSAPRATAHAL